MESTTLTDEERIHIGMALEMRANWIETGNPVLSAEDAKNGAIIRGFRADAVLLPEQTVFVNQLRELARKVKP